MLKYDFVPFEFPKSNDGKFFLGLDDAGVLRSRREQLGLTQQQVAEMAGVKFSQYQRLESGERNLSGCSMRIGLSICAVLLLNPYDMITVTAKQPDPSVMKPQAPFDSASPKEQGRKKVGRKQIRRDVFPVYFNHHLYPIIIPRNALEAIGKPANIIVYWNADELRLLFCGTTISNENYIDVPDVLYTDCSALACPTADIITEVKNVLGWTNDIYSVDGCIALDQNKELVIFCDLKTAHKSEEHIIGSFAVPSFFDDEQ